MKKGRIKDGIGQIVMLAGYLLMGLGCGLLTAKYIDGMGGGLIGMLTVMLIGVYGSLLLHIVLHEAGHMIFGLMTGYRFCSFRIGSFVWQRTAEGGFSFGYAPMPGAAGQCLMSPPEMRDGKMPYVMYNLGGALMNLIASLVCLLAAAIAAHPVADAMLYMCALVGLVTALTNAIPMRVGALDNDGRNILSMRESGEAIRALWVQLKVAEQNALGVRLKDMPEEWFYMPSRAAMKNSLCAAVGVFYCSRMMDRMEFDGAMRAMQGMMRMGGSMAGLHQASVRMDMAYCELAAGNGKDAAEKQLDPGTRKIMKAMRSHIGVLRTEYALALLGEEDWEKAEKIEAQFEAAAKKWPSRADVESERELVEYAKRKAEAA